MIKKILVLVAIALVAFLVVAAFQPADYKVTRSIAVAAPASVPFALVNDFHQWTAWSPWEKLDPEMKRGHEGASVGTGAIYTWAGNNKVGVGRATIIESRPNELIRIRLDFSEPFASTATAEYAFRPEGGQTAVTWSMAGEKNFLSKAMGLIVSMDKMIGPDFEQGLANLKSASEAAGKK